jgi:hypothetical protein
MTQWHKTYGAVGLFAFDGSHQVNILMLAPPVGDGWTLRSTDE